MAANQSDLPTAAEILDRFCKCSNPELTLKHDDHRLWQPSIICNFQANLDLDKAESVYMAASPEDRDFENGMGPTLSKDLVLFQSPDLPYSESVYRGHDGFQQWAQEMAALFSKLIVAEAKVYEREGADEVLVHSRLQLISRDTGEEFERPMVQVMNVDRKAGVITVIQPFYWDVEGLKKKLGK